MARWGLPQAGGRGGDGTGVLFHPPGQSARHVLFVCDATGTMINKSGSLKAQLVKAIANLRPNQAFNVIFFTDGGKFHIANKSGLVMANAETKRAVFNFLQEITPLGTTDPLPALQAAFAQKPNLIYFLSDGEFNNLKPYEEVVSQIRTMNREGRTRVNTILFDTYDAKAEEMMRQIAKENGGEYRYVREADLQ